MVYYKATGELWPTDTFWGTFGMSSDFLDPSQADIYLFKVNNRNTRTISKICSKLTNKDNRMTSMMSRMTVVFIVNFEQISNIVLVFLLLT